MATGGGAFSRTKSLEETLSCPVCLEIFDNPMTIPCGHTFCGDCLDSCENLSGSGSSTCPVCRAGFNSRRKVPARDIQQQILRNTGTCPNCKRQFPMSSLRAHRASCVKVRSPSFSPVGATSQPWPNVENRSTFTCPYCQEANLDHKALLRHVNNNHRHEKKPVVCPICSSMPWGDPNQRSGDFIHHLNLRHKFEYNTFVDFEQDEDAILQQVLAQSRQDH